MQFMHSIELNNKFLIFGFTGPLRSGCTTSANMFTRNIHEVIKNYLEEPDQLNIEETYKDINTGLKEYNDNAVIEHKKLMLYSLLKKREIKDVLQSKLNKNFVKPFYYISMSKMVIKYSIEYYLNNRSDYFDGLFKPIIDEIDSLKIDIDIINIINAQITNKKYRDITTELCKYYDTYLNGIDKLYYDMRQNIDLNRLGIMLQDMGDNIRRSGIPFRNSAYYDSRNVTKIAEEANKLIKYYRNRQDNEQNRKHHFVIESFRNPYEVEYFRYRYYEFYLFSIYTDKEERKSSRGIFSESRDLRDSGSSKKAHEIYKQDVTRCVYLSDISINNDGSLNQLYEKLLRYYAIILNPGCITPSAHEMFMSQAYSLSLKSSCISRQVGAIIIGKNGYVVGAGWNDAGEGQVGCGYRQAQDIKNLSNEVLVTNPETEKVFRRLLLRDKEMHEPFCYKDEYSKFLIHKKLAAFTKNKLAEVSELGDETKTTIERWLKDEIKIKRLEYCRALHAEENALLQSAKIGGVGVKEGTIYTTSFPCELCAKKIYQAGIIEVIYTEPYPDSISQNVIFKDGIKRVKLTQFEGVKSHSYFRLYKSSMDRKELIEICKMEQKQNSDNLSLF